MVSKKLISVIVPVFNVEDYLDRCIQSIVSQTYEQLDIILVDDGSSDQCPVLCDRWAEKDNRIRVIHKENGGVSSARNAGLKIADGDWISFVDSDDIIHPEYFEVLMMLAEKSFSNVTSVNYFRVVEYQEPVASCKEKISFKSISGDDIVNKWFYRFFVWGKLYAKNIVEGYGFDESVFFGEDILFNIAVLSQAGIKITYTNERLYYYCIRPGSAVSEDRHRKRAELCKTYLKYADLENNKRIKKVYLEHAIKRALFTRYDVSIQKEYQSIEKDCNLCLKSALKNSTVWQGTARLIYFMYTIFYRFPKVYRLWRIVNEPSLLLWKKKMRTDKKKFPKNLFR